MALRIVRKASNVANVSNRDDACMVRYAYGGYDGIVQGFGEECIVTGLDTNKITLHSGRIVVQGWEIDVDQQDFYVNATHRYNYLYLTLNLLTESAETSIIASSSISPPLSSGDDLTQNTSGTARVCICSVTVSSGLVSSILPVISTIQREKYWHETFSSQISDIHDRLQRLGFKEGSIILPSGVAVQEGRRNNITRQGNYVIGGLDIVPTGSSFPKSSAFNLLQGYMLGTIPSEFLPEFESFDIAPEIAARGSLIPAACLFENKFTGAQNILLYFLTILEDGGMWLFDLSIPSDAGSFTACRMFFGYEAAPL